jgi:hypothetical protein
MAGRVHARLTREAPAYFDGERRAFSKLIRKLLPGFSLMQPVTQLKACDEARDLIRSYRTHEPKRSRSPFARRCERTISLLGNLKTEIVRRARADAKAHRKFMSCKY